MVYLALSILVIAATLGRTFTHQHGFGLARGKAPEFHHKGKELFILRVMYLKTRHLHAKNQFILEIYSPLSIRYNKFSCR